MKEDPSGESNRSARPFGRFSKHLPCCLECRQPTHATLLEDVKESDYFSQHAASAFAKKHIKTTNPQPS